MDLPPLDGAPGPARPISPRREREMIEVAVGRQFGRRRLPAFWRAAAAILITFGALGAAAAFTYLMLRPRLPEPTRSPAPRSRPTPVVRPAPPDGGLPPDLAPDLAPAARPAQHRGARDLLARANRARAARRWREAERGYRTVVRRFPGTDQAYVARVSAAALRQRHLGDPRGALTEYRLALADHRRYLREEVLYGVAECQRALGRREAERHALRAYLQAFPGGAMAEGARRRLEQLGVH